MMFVFLDNDQFLVNPNCPVVVLMQHIKTRLQLAESGMYSSLYAFSHASTYEDNQSFFFQFKALSLNRILSFEDTFSHSRAVLLSFKF